MLGDIGVSMTQFDEHNKNVNTIPYIEVIDEIFACLFVFFFRFSIGKAHGVS